MKINSTLIPECHVASGNGLSVSNPATGKEIACVKDWSLAEIENAIVVAESAQKEWAAQPAKTRASTLKRWNDLILENQDELATIITAECGKPIAEAKGEVAYGASFVEWFAEEGKRAYGDVIPHHAPGKRLMTIKQPVGVTAAITPWNFPLAMITRKVAPALAAGCAMLVKPAEATPLTALAIESLAHQAGIPQALFRIVTTADPVSVGKLFCSNAVIRKISFTGSTAVGKILLEQCAGTVKRTSMELGGNAPFIVFDDADIDAAVDGALASKFRNAGQTCVCANRFFVQSSVYNSFVSKLAERVSKIKVGDGAKTDTEVGPLINKAGLEKVSRLVEDAVSKGAEAVTGGKRLTIGECFYEPTVLRDVTTEMDILHAEIFGPVAPITKFDTDDEVIALANNTPYGLAAYFYAKDISRIWRVMEELEFGMVGINDGILSTEVAPFGGVKESGIGREGARLGLEEYLETKYALIGGMMS